VIATAVRFAAVAAMAVLLTRASARIPTVSANERSR
jgi:hypothetical protein